MKKLFVLLFVVVYGQLACSQDYTGKVVDSLYREDQFYIGVSYILIGNKPEDLSQTGFSSSFQLGFIRDMPINKNRNMALGLGLGVSSNSVNPNLLIDKDDLGNTSFQILNDNSTFSKNKFSTFLIELPFEFRWRTSTPEEYKFWRIYTGFKIGYLFAHRSKYKGELGNIKHYSISSFNDFQYGLTLSVGYNTWNINFYYGLNPIFSDGSLLNGKQLDMNVIKFGLMFYIL